MIWLKRLIPLIVIVAVWGAWEYRQYSTAREDQQLADRYALTTAKVWLASGHYRENPARYMLFRDSLLTAEGLSADSMFTFLEIYRKRPEKYELFATRVTELVDSLMPLTETFLPLKAGGQ